MLPRRVLSPQTAALTLLSLLACVRPSAAQTPSPFPYWQNAAGMVLAPLGGPVPEWRISVGGGGAFLPVYEGSDHYTVQPSPVFDVRYKDVAFLSIGDGLGINLIRGQTYRAGIAIGYDVGRDQHLAERLNGLGDIDPAPEPRLFAEVAVLPVVMTFDLRRAIGGNHGLIGDIGAYVPVVGQRNLVVFFGPSVSFADDRYMQSYFGISEAQSLSSFEHFAPYDADAGLKDVELGLTGIYHFTDQWFADASMSWERLAGAAGNSPIVQDRDQVGVSLNLGYEF